MTLTTDEIYDLALLAGILNDPPVRPDPEEGAMEITIGVCPQDGIRTEKNDRPMRYRMIAWYMDYPFEGSLGLGPATELLEKSAQAVG